MQILINTQEKKAVFCTGYLFHQFKRIFLLIYRFMQQLEDALNIDLCGHFLTSLIATCLAAFSAVTVRLKMLTPTLKTAMHVFYVK
jgi:hypothetical protein